MPSLAAPMPVISVSFQFECLCCPAEHLPFLLYSFGRHHMCFIMAYIHIPKWLMILSIICHLCAFFGVLFIQIISPLLVHCPFIVKLWIFFVVWRWELCIILPLLWVLSSHSDACRNPESCRGYSVVIFRVSLWSQREKCAQDRMCEKTPVRGGSRHCPLDTVADFSETVSYGWDPMSALA